MKPISSAACGLFLTITGCGAMNAPLSTVDFVDVPRYMGKWYEIARYPTRFEDGCVGVTADYELRDDGRVNVLNTCIEGELDGPVRTIEGTARVVDQATNAKLAVRFFWFFEGAYWVLELGDDYEYAVVGEPGRDFLWILSRTPRMDEAIFAGILERLPEKGYDPERLELVLQDTAE